MIAVQVMANDVAVGFGGAGGYLEMNVYKPLMIHHVTQPITTDRCSNIRKFLEGTKPYLKKISEYVERSLMFVAARYRLRQRLDIAHYAMDNDFTSMTAASKWALSARRIR